MQVLKNKLLVFLFLSLIPFVQVLGQNRFAKTENQKIWEAKDRNDLVYTSEILEKGNLDQKAIALAGLNSWYDPSLSSILLKIVKKEDPQLKILALSAIGQSHDSLFVDPLYKLSKKRKYRKYRSQLLVALGKCVNKKKLFRLISYSGKDHEGLAEAWFRAMIRGVHNETMDRDVLNFLSQNNPENRFYAAWYLARRNHLNSEGIRKLAQFATDAEMLGWKEDVCIPVYYSLGKCKADKPDSLIIRKTLNDLLVRYSVANSTLNDLKIVAVLRAMSTGKYLPDPDSFEKMKRLFDQKNPALEFALSEVLALKCPFLLNKFNPRYMPSVLNLINSENCKGYGSETEPLNSYFDKVWEVKKLSGFYGNYAQIKYILLQSEHPAIKTAATESFLACAGLENFPGSLQEDVLSTLKVLIKDGDVGVLSIIANEILNSSIKLNKDEQSEFKKMLEDAQKRLELPRDMEANLDIHKVLALFEGTRYMAPLPEWNHPIDWDYVSKIAAGQQIEINTSKGSIKVKLNVNEAPGSVASILKLIDKGFYNSKTFHRLVPNFVIQGGCPRGDGFGSADYSIRSEFSDLIYSSGTVGLASSGPNTESCQWFITHCATPHLDGRYTIIGHVIEGMDVVQLLGVGDVILEIKRL